MSNEQAHEYVQKIYAAILPVRKIGEYYHVTVSRLVKSHLELGALKVLIAEGGPK